MDVSNAQLTSIFNIATSQARAIAYLDYVDIVVSLLIGLTVVGLLTFVSIKFRHKAGDAEPEQSSGNIKYEITWTVIPALILFAMGILTAIVMHEVNPPLRSRQADIVINAHQWWWEYRYPKFGVVTANELYLPEGANSVLELRAADVIHSFWVPAFGEKMDAIPGHPNYLRLDPIKSGTFLGSCSEYCGADHALMRIIAKVVPKEEFDSWIKKQAAPTAASSTAEQNQGKQLFMANTCGQCHNIAGTTANGQIGPDLTHLSLRQSLGAGLIPNTAENAAAWIINPQKFKPGCHMPPMRLSKDEAHAIAVYLESL